MKLLLFLLIVTVCGSLNKPVQPCSKNLVVRYYYEGKYKARADFANETRFDVVPMKLNVHARKNFTVITDSIVIRFK